MPTLTPLNNDMPDIDPDALTVNLTGDGPDQDDLVKQPENVRMPEEQEVVEFGSHKDATEEETQADADLIAEDSIPGSEDDAEVREIEKLLRKKKSERLRMRSSSADVKKPKKKVDYVVIISSVLAVILAGLAIAYFAGLFESKDTIGMTVDEFSKAYATTTGYSALSKYGFAFPNVTYSDGDSAGITTDATATPSPYRNFSGYFENSLGYQFAVRGAVNRSDGKITSLSVMLLLTTQKAYTDSIAVYAPVLQVLYPELTIQQSIDLANQLIASSAAATVKGDYAIAMVTSGTENPYYGELYVVSKTNVDTLNSMLAQRTAPSDAA